MIKTADLKAQTRRELADMARDYGISGWHGMRKDDLIVELQKVQRKMQRQRATGAKSGSSGGKSASKCSPKQPSQAKTKTLAASKAAKNAQAKPLTAKSAIQPSGKSNQVASKSPQSSSNQTSGNQTSGNQSSSNQSSGNQSSGKSNNPSSKKATAATSKARAAADSRPIPKLPESRIDPKTARIRSQLRRRRETMQQHRDLSTSTLVKGTAVSNGKNSPEEAHRDRVVLMVRGPFWLQANWEITQSSVERARVSLAERWHLAQPTLRLLAIGDVDSNASESVVRDIAVHGGVDNWYIDVDEPPHRFRVLIGYCVGDEFHTLCRSNVVETPPVGQCERLDEHWVDIAEDYERIYSLSGGYDSDDGDLREMFEQRMHRTMPLRASDGTTVNDPSLLKQTKLPFAVEAELIVFGKSTPGAAVSISGNPVKTKDDGSFTVRMQLPDKRQVLPVTSESQDGLQQRTTVIAIERNTKVLEPVSRDELFQ